MKSITKVIKHQLSTSLCRWYVNLCTIHVWSDTERDVCPIPQVNGLPHRKRRESLDLSTCCKLHDQIWNISPLNRRRINGAGLVQHTSKWCIAFKHAMTHACDWGRTSRVRSKHAWKWLFNWSRTSVTSSRAGHSISGNVLVAVVTVSVSVEFARIPAYSLA